MENGLLFFRRKLVIVTVPSQNLLKICMHLIHIHTKLDRSDQNKHIIVDVIKNACFDHDRCDNHSFKTELFEKNQIDRVQTFQLKLTLVQMLRINLFYFKHDQRVCTTSVKLNDIFFAENYFNEPDNTSVYLWF